MDFGFHINPSSTINLDNVDRHLYFKLAKLEPGVRTCIGCGSCTATCTAGPFNGMSLRKVLLALERGTDISEMLKGCMLCGKCTMVCPRGINTRNAILNLCRIYGEEGNVKGRRK